MIDKLAEFPRFRYLKKLELDGFQLTDFNVDAFKVFVKVSYIFMIYDNS